MFFDTWMQRWKEKAGALDFTLLKLSSAVFGIWLATLFPQLTSYDHWMVLGLAVILWIKPAMVVLKK
jgi:hypothetical protein